MSIHINMKANREDLSYLVAKSKSGLMELSALSTKMLAESPMRGFSATPSSHAILDSIKQHVLETIGLMDEMSRLMCHKTICEFSVNYYEYIILLALLFYTPSEFRVLLSRKDLTLENFITPDEMWADLRTLRDKENA